jgi:hypothetical protein
MYLSVLSLRFLSFFLMFFSVFLLVLLSNSVQNLSTSTEKLARSGTESLLTQLMLIFCIVFKAVSPAEELSKPCSILRWV